MKGGATWNKDGVAIGALVVGVGILLSDDAAKGGADFAFRFWLPGGILILLGGGFLLYRLIVRH